MLVAPAARHESTAAMPDATYWAITAHINQKVGKWEHQVSLPTFYLNGDVQGIVDEKHAERIARSILLDGRDLNRDDELHVHVVRMP